MSASLRLAGPAPSLEEVFGQSPPELSLVTMRRHAESPPALDVAAVTRGQLGPVVRQVTPGMRIALAVGSRGIAELPTVVATAVAELRRAGASPFIVPAMGSHGGATAAGQERLLASLGITAEAVGAPVESSMDTVRLGRAETGQEVYLDRLAASADAVLPVNRVKSHTSFHGEIESGLAKMLAVGLGKRDGARELHRLGPAHLERRIRAAAALIRGRVRVLGGLALIEDELRRLRHIELLPDGEIGSAGEARLLELARRMSPRLPVSPIDVLIVDAMGKDRSGTGMDTNVIGRMMVRGSAEPAGPSVTNLVAASLTEASHGNATGLGLADFIPQRLASEVDLNATYANSLTAGLQGVQRAQLPVTLATDRDAVGAAVLTAAVPDLSKVRIVRIQDTLHLNEIMVSRALADECRAAGFEQVTERGTALFDAQGRLAPWPVSAADGGNRE
ncbi:MAG TPA: DUF362 domain-containing protein [Trebonia sp.]|nr:DUF362 domain-containing protein [Trebonia sp.]